MKKITLLLLALSLSFCSKKDDDTKNANSTTVTPEATLLNKATTQ